MKKLLMAMAITASMAMASVCAAAGEGAVLTKEQKAAEAFFSGMNGVAEITYAQATTGLDPELKAKVTEQAYNNIKKNVKDKFGACKETKFVAFIRGGNLDRVEYLGKYAKEEAVGMAFFFNPAGKIVSFSLSPIKKPAPAPTPAPAPAKPAK